MLTSMPVEEYCTESLFEISASLQKAVEYMQNVVGLQTFIPQGIISAKGI